MSCRIELACGNNQNNNPQNTTSMTTPYFHLYGHLIGDISIDDMKLLQDAEWQQWEDIPTGKAQSPEVERILQSIAREKSLREECYI